MKKRKNRYWFKNCIATKLQAQDDRVLTMLVGLSAFDFELVTASGKTKIIKDGLQMILYPVKRNCIVAIVQKESCK